MLSPLLICSKSKQYSLTKLKFSPIQTCMSSFNLAKRLQPARKAWKSFRNRLQSKLRDSKLVIATITALGQRCSIAWQSIFRFLHRKALGITKRAVPPRSHRHLHLYRHHVGHSYSPIYVDELFPGLVALAEPGKIKEGMAESSSTSVSDNKSRPGSAVETHRGGKIQIQDKVRAKIPGDDEKGLAPVGKGKAKLAGESSESSGSAEKWKLPMIPQFKGVDERAEEFIAKFRQDMKLEREQSILEFEEMLKRSA